MTKPVVTEKQAEKLIEELARLSGRSIEDARAQIEAVVEVAKPIIRVHAQTMARAGFEEYQGRVLPLAHNGGKR